MDCEDVEPKEKDLFLTIKAFSTTAAQLSEELNNENIFIFKIKALLKSFKVVLFDIFN